MLEASGRSVLEASGRAALEASGRVILEASGRAALEAVEASECFALPEPSGTLEASELDTTLGPSCAVQHGNAANVPRAKVRRRSSGTGAT